MATRILVLIMVVLLLASCVGLKPEAVSVTQLVQEPRLYVGKLVQVSGFLVEELGVKSYYVYETQVSYDPIAKKTIVTGRSVEVRESSWTFSNGDDEIYVILEEKGLSSLPLPIVPVLTSHFENQKLVLVGTWKKAEDGYLLYATSIYQQ